jgi:branched-chain amino acid transport system ATP-binding protein
MILRTESVVKRFGGLVAVNNVSIQVEEGTIFGLIGPNGAGKTTLLNVIAGVYRPEGGKVFFQGEDITVLSPEQVCHKGIARTFQIVRAFKDMTVLENVMVPAIFGGLGHRGNPAKKAREVLEFVEFPMPVDTVAKHLNTAQLKRLDLARALASEPRMLLLDELAAGLTPTELVDFICTIRRIRDQGITIMTIEHVMRVIMEICDQIAVLHYGEKIAEGPPDEIVKNKKVAEAYLGETYIL